MTRVEIFQQNLGLLGRFSAAWAKRLREMPWEVALAGEAQFAGENQTPGERAKAWVKGLGLADEAVVFVYGISAGGEEFLALKDWAERSPMRSVVFLVDDLAVTRGFLETKLATELLTHSQFVFKLFDWESLDKQDVLQQEFDWLLKAFSIVKTVFTCKICANKTEFDRLNGRLQLLKKVFKEKFDNWLSTYHNYLETQKKILASSYPNLLELPNAAFGHAMRNACKNIPAIICGAGPSLEQRLEKLKDLQNKALIFGAGSALNVLSRYGILPHFGAGLDPAETQLSRLSTNFAFQVPFFYVNRFNHSALQYLQGDKIYLRGGTRLHVGDWFDNQLSLNKDEPIASGKSTSNFCLEIAGMLGCNPIVLIGMDLSYSPSGRYAAGVTAHPADEPQHHQSLGPSKQRIIKVADSAGQEHSTTRNWIQEAECFTDFCNRNPHVTVLNATEGGMPIASIPNVSLDSIIESHLQSTREFDSLVHTMIQNNSLETTPKRIEEALLKWQTELESAKNLILAYLKKGEYPLGLLTKILQQHDCYAAFLKQYDTLFDALNSRDYFRLAHFPEAFPPWMQKDMIERLELERARFFLEKIHDHASMTVEALSLPFTSIAPKSAPLDKRTNLVETQSQENDECTKKFYYSTGELYAVKRYRSGLLHGVQEFYFTDGTCRSQLEYQEGLLHGTILLYYPGEKPKRELHFVHGQLEGSERIWNASGQLVKEACYQANQPIGISRAWHPNGQLAREVAHQAEEGGDLLSEWNSEGKQTLSSVFLPKALTDTPKK